MDEHIHQSNLIEGYDDPEFDKQGMIAWGYLKGQTELSHGVIHKIQKILTLKQDDLQPDWRGYYRTIPVYIGGHEAPHYSIIRPRMDDFISDMNLGYAEPSQTPQKMHVRFEKIHPYVDGNGRTGRLLMWWHEERLGLEPTLIEFAYVNKYYEWFR